MSGCWPRVGEGSKKHRFKPEQCWRGGGDEGVCPWLLGATSHPATDLPRVHHLTLSLSLLSAQRISPPPDNSLPVFILSYLPPSMAVAEPKGTALITSLPCSKILPF